MTKTPFNRALLEQAVAWARRSAEQGALVVKHDDEEVGEVQWVQQNWLTVLEDDGEWSAVRYFDDFQFEEVAECGTGCCLAGYLALHTIGADGTDAKALNDLWAKVTNEYDGWTDFGVQVLGITYHEADNLFEGSNTIAQIEEQADALIAKYEGVSA